MIIPTKDEVIGIRSVLPSVKKEWANEWIIIDGDSKDGTVEEAEKLGFKIIQQKGKGLADAYREGVCIANSENVLFFSPDGNCEPENIVRLIQKMEEGQYDIVQISRNNYGGSSDDDTTITSFGNKMFTFLVNVFFGGHFTDALYGFKIIKKKFFEELNLDGQSLTLEQQICIKACKLRLKICEIGGREPKRIGGEAKMKPLFTGYMLSKQIIKEFIFW